MPNLIRQVIVFMALIWGNDEDYGRSLKLQEDGSILIAGYTKSKGLGTNGVFQKTQAGRKDAFISKFKPNGMLDWFTYYGGPGHDEGQEMDVDEGGNIYLTGDVESKTGIATPGAYKVTLSTDTIGDCMIAKFIDRCFDRYEPNNTLGSATPIVVLPNETTIINGEINNAGDIDNFTFTNSQGLNINIQLSDLPLNYDIYLYAPDGQLVAQSNKSNEQNEEIIFNTSNAGAYTVQVKSESPSAFNDAACYELTISLTSCGSLNAYINASGPLTFCDSGSVKLNVSLIDSGLLSMVNQQRNYSRCNRFILYCICCRQLCRDSFRWIVYSNIRHHISNRKSYPGRNYFTIRQRGRMQW